MGGHISVEQELGAMFGGKSSVVVAEGVMGWVLSLSWKKHGMGLGQYAYLLSVEEKRSGWDITVASWVIALDDRFTPEVMKNIFDVLDCVHMLGRGSGYNLCSPFL